MKKSLLYQLSPKSLSYNSSGFGYLHKTLRSTIHDQLTNKTIIRCFIRGHLAIQMLVRCFINNVFHMISSYFSN